MARTIQYHTDSPAKILFAICFPLVLVNVVLAVTTTLNLQTAVYLTLYYGFTF